MSIRMYHSLPANHDARYVLMRTCKYSDQKDFIVCKRSDDKDEAINEIVPSDHEDHFLWDRRLDVEYPVDGR